MDSSHTSSPVAAFIAAWRSGTTPAPSPPDLYGRILYGSSPSDFAALSYGNKPFAWATPAADLAQVIPAGDEAARLLTLRDGQITPVGVSYIRNLLAKGTRWKLVLFPCQAAFPATWEGLIAYVAQREGGAVAEQLLRQAPALQERTFAGALEPYVSDDEVRALHLRQEGQTGAGFDASWYASAEDTAHNAALFLWSTCGVRRAFRGDGLSARLSNGQGVREFGVPNTPLHELEGCAVIDLEGIPSSSLLQA